MPDPATAQSDGKIRVLQDLSMAMLGHSGIPQDARLMFKTFARWPEIELTGLLSEMGPGLTEYVPTATSKDRQMNVLAGSLFLLGVSGIELQPRRRIPNRFSRLIKYIQLLNRRYQIAPIELKQLDDAIWRLFFQKTLAADDRELIQSQRFAFTNLNFVSFLRRLRSPIFRPPSLDTRGYDFLITSEPRPLRLSPGTRHIARVHDLIPLSDADMFSDADVVRTAFQMTNKSSPSTIFCCVSRPSEETLLQVFPNLKGRTTTIPNALPDFEFHDGEVLPIGEIVRTRFSGAVFGDDEDRTILRSQSLRRTKLSKSFRYVLGLSTIEPRKNFSTLVRAWERVRYQADSELKLIIVGRPGWRYESALSTMRAGVMAGDLLHLQDLSAIELQALYRNAECLVFPSFAEGFGFPPLEAMQCGTPAIVSDIASHRWVMGDAALYVDPYNVQDVAAKIMMLTVASDRQDLRATLRMRAGLQLARYTADTVAGQWADMFGRLRRGEAPISDLDGNS